MTNVSITVHCLAFGVFMGPVLGQNIVPNGSFEQMLLCPGAQSQLDHTAFWFSPTTQGTPDYYHACSESYGVPMSANGNEAAHDGEAYAGIYLYIGSFTDGREYLEVQLIHSLQQGACYHLEFHVSLAESSDHMTDGIGAFLSDQPLQDIPGFPLLDVLPCVSNPAGILADANGWMAVSGDIVAAGNEQYLVIGNFRTDAESLIYPTGLPHWDMAYVFVDDVRLELCSTVSMAEPAAPAAAAIVPSSFSQEFIFGPATCEGAQARIVNTTGVEVFKGAIRPYQEVRSADWPSGSYLIDIRCPDGSRTWGRSLRVE